MMTLRWGVKSMVVMGLCCAPVLFASQAAPKMTVADTKDAKAAETKISEIEKNVDLALGMLTAAVESGQAEEYVQQAKELFAELRKISLDDLAPVILKKFKQGLVVDEQFFSGYDFSQLNKLPVAGGDWNDEIVKFNKFVDKARQNKIPLPSLVALVHVCWGNLASENILVYMLKKLPEKYIEKSFKAAAGTIDAKLAVRQENALWTELVEHVEKLLSFGRVMVIDPDEALADITSRLIHRLLLHSAIHGVLGAMEHEQADAAATHADEHATTSADEEKQSSCCIQ